MTRNAANYDGEVLPTITMDPTQNITSPYFVRPNKSPSNSLVTKLRINIILGRNCCTYFSLQEKIWRGSKNDSSKV